jgi:hypothetical protein
VAALVLLLPRMAEPSLLHAAARALCSQHECLIALQLILQALRLFLLLLLPLEAAIPAGQHLASTAEVLTSLLLLLHHSMHPA